MKKVIILSALRTGSSYLTDNLALSIRKKYSIRPSIKHYRFNDTLLDANDDIVTGDFSVTKISWIGHLEQLKKIDDLSNYDVFFLKRKDKFAQCISMVTAVPNPIWAFNFYKEEEHLWKDWVEKDPKFYVPKETFCLFFWMREYLERNVEKYKSNFKSFTELNYEDIDGNTDNIKSILEKIDLPDHEDYESDALPIKRNWNIWGSVVNKEEVLSWAEPLFKQEGYTINPEYYK